MRTKMNSTEKRDLKATLIERAIVNCIDWADPSNCDDIRAYKLAKKNFKLLPDNTKAQNLLRLTRKYMNNSDYTKPTDDFLIFMGHIMQNVYPD